MNCLEHHITSLPADCRIRESEGSQMLQLIEECFQMHMMPVAIRQPSAILPKDDLSTRRPPTSVASILTGYKNTLSLLF